MWIILAATCHQLRDEMYIKLDQKDVPYKSHIYQKISRGQNRQNFRQSIAWGGNRFYSREHSYNSNRGYERGRSNFRRGRF